MILYRTVRGPARTQQVIERSRFITSVSPVSDRDEAERFIAEIRDEFKDATHNVPAMVIGEKASIQWGSDDGEPQGTAGAPIVQMIVKEGLTNVAVVVTRYFGGIKLGTGGLVRAYTGCAREGLAAAGPCSVREVAVIRIKVDYTYISKLQNLAAAGSLDEGDASCLFRTDRIEYSDKVDMDIITLPENEADVMGLLADITSGSVQILERSTRTEKA